MEPSLCGEGGRWVGCEEAGERLVEDRMSDDEFVLSGGCCWEEGGCEGGGGGWISTLQPLLTPSTSKPSRNTRILPQESQLGGTRTLSLSMTLCFTVWRLRREWMPREEWIRVGRELGTEREV